MKIALCLYGVVGATNGKADSPLARASLDILNLGYEKYKSSLLNHHDVDIYIHTWSKQFEKEILNLYKPKKHLIEQQEIFEIPNHVIGDDSEQPKRRQGCYSRWRSTQKVLKLKSETGKKYDFTLLSRFDVGFENQIDFSHLEKDNIYLSNWVGARYENVSDIFEDGRGIYYQQKDSLDKDKIKLYGRGFPYNNEGVLDYWVLGGGESIQILETLFENINSYQASGPIAHQRISNHQLLLHHLRENHPVDKLGFIMNPMEDHCLLRYKYFGCKDSNISTLLRSSN